jgi:carbamoyl-phosphate synthase large subunit
MRVVHSESELSNVISETVAASDQRSVLLDRFLHNAIEVDVDCVSDGSEVIISGVMEHIERAGIHSGDSSCCIPPQTLSAATVRELKRQTEVLARSLKVVGLMNVQFAVQKSDKGEPTVYLLEVNPRASRTVPFVSKATGIPWAKVAARVMAGASLKSIGVREAPEAAGVAVKACVFPFAKFQGVDTILGPEMKSTGEVMGLHASFGGSFAKAQLAASIKLPRAGAAFLSVADGDKEELPAIAERLKAEGFSLLATQGTAEYLKKRGIEVTAVRKVRDGSPHIVDLLGEGKVQLVVNTPEGGTSKSIGTLLDSRSIRLVANEMGIPTFTTMAAALAGAHAIHSLREGEVVQVQALQDYHKLVVARAKAA